MEPLFFFAGIASTLLVGLLIYLIMLSQPERALLHERMGHPWREVDVDFRLFTCTTEIILVPSSPKGAEFITRLQDSDPANLYYRALIVERNNLLKFAEHALSCGLAISYQPNGRRASRFVLFK